MVTKRKPVVPIDETDTWLAQGDIDSSQNVQEQQTNLLGDALVVFGVFAGIATVGKLYDESQVPETEPSKFTDVLGGIASQVVPSDFTVTTNIYDYFIQNDEGNFGFNQNQVDQYQQLSDDLSMYGRVADKDTIENIDFQNAQSISEQMGTFGYIEGEKQGELTTYRDLKEQGHTVLIPWETEGDERVCDDCEELEGQLFAPEDYPEPPHYGCRCEPGEPEIELENE